MRSNPQQGLRQVKLVLLERFLKRRQRKPPAWLMRRIKRRFPEVELIWRPDRQRWELIEKSRTLRGWLHIRYLERVVRIENPGYGQSHYTTVPEEPNYINTYLYLADHDLNVVLANQSLDNYLSSMDEAWNRETGQVEEAAMDGPVREGSERLLHTLMPRTVVTPNPGGKKCST